MENDKSRKTLLLVILAGMFVIFTINSQYFLTPDNVLSILREASTVGIMALGMTLVIITAGIDLSVGSVVAFCAMMITNLFVYTSMPLLPAVLVTCAAGIAVGVFNGIAITKLNIPDFIVTLSTMVIFRGLTAVIAVRDAGGFIKNVTIPNLDFGFISGKIGPIYNIIICFVVLAFLSSFILKKTRIGTHIYATGADRRSAMLSGINVGRAKVFAYAFSGLMAGVAAIFMSSRIMSAIVDLADGIEMDVIAAVVVGGTLFAGGKGDIWGTVLGAVFLATLQNGIYKFDISSAYQPVILGIVIIASIMLDELSRRFKIKKQQGGSPAPAK